MSMHLARDLVVDSVTGVDLKLPIAGAGARCYAFAIDWLIRAILCSAWYGLAALIYNGRWSFAAPLSPDTRWFVFVVAPAAASYFLYHLVLEIALHGRTPGKRMAGLHIVARDGSSPGVGALLTRNVFRLVDSLPLFYGVGLVAALVTKDHLRIGDMAAGTLLAYDRTDVVLPTSPDNQTRDRILSAADVEVINDLLLRWPMLDPTARHRLARGIISRYSGGAPPGEERKPDSNPDSTLRAQLEALAQGRAV
jgi:uncharacterized RDD family membrane protein YckC